MSCGTQTIRLFTPDCEFCEEGFCVDSPIEASFSPPSSQPTPPRTFNTTCNYPRKPNLPKAGIMKSKMLQIYKTKVICSDTQKIMSSLFSEI